MSDDVLNGISSGASGDFSGTPENESEAPLSKGRAVYEGVTEGAKKGWEERKARKSGATDHEKNIERSDDGAKKLGEPEQEEDESDDENQDEQNENEGQKEGQDEQQNQSEDQQGQDGGGDDGDDEKEDKPRGPLGNWMKKREDKKKIKQIKKDVKKDRLKDKALGVYGRHGIMKNNVKWGVAREGKDSLIDMHDKNLNRETNEKAEIANELESAPNEIGKVEKLYKEYNKKKKAAEISSKEVKEDFAFILLKRFIEGPRGCLKDARGCLMGSMKTIMLTILGSGIITAILKLCGLF